MGVDLILKCKRCGVDLGWFGRAHHYKIPNDNGLAEDRRILQSIATDKIVGDCMDFIKGTLKSNELMQNLRDHLENMFEDAERCGCIGMVNIMLESGNVDREES